jgi:NAD(P)-dependent dehydrogenase (short-subunit alcohol dehydrogenase family)
MHGIIEDRQGMGALTGKVAVVTGVPRGIDRATAERLAKDGAPLWSTTCMRKSIVSSAISEAFVAY